MNKSHKRKLSKTIDNEQLRNCGNAGSGAHTHTHI